MAVLRKQNGHEDPWVVDYFGVGNENWGCGCYVELRAAAKKAACPYEKW